MVKLDDVSKELMYLSPLDLEIVNGLIAHLRKMTSTPITENLDDPALYWQEMAGDNQWRHNTAAPVWSELAEALKKPTENFRKIQQLKLRLKALGEL